MALDAGSIVYKTKFDDSGLKSGLSKSTGTIKSTASKAGESVGNLNTKLSKTQTLSGGITKAFGALLGAGFIAKMGKDIFEAGTALETMRIQFEQLTGSSEGAEKMLDVLNKFADVTPNTNAEVLKAGKILATFNSDLSSDSDALQATLLKVGNAAAFASAPIDQMAEIFGKATAEGKLTAETLNQFTTRGVPLREELKRMFKVSDEGLRNLVSSGKVTSDVVEQAFTNMSAEGGALSGSMERLSKSVGGLVSTAIGPLKQRFAEVALTVISALKPAIEGFIGLMNKIGPTGQKVAITMGLLTAAAGAFFLVIKSGIVAAIAGFITLNAVLIATGIGAIFVGIGVTITLLISYWDELIATGKAFVAFITSIFVPIIEKVKQMFLGTQDEVGLLSKAIDKIKSVIDSLAKFWIKVWTAILDTVQPLFTGIVKVFNKVTSFIISRVAFILQKIKEILLSAKKVFEFFGVDVDKAVGNLNESLKKIWGDKEKKEAEDAGKNIGKSLTKGLDDATQDTGKVVEKSVADWSDKVKDSIKTTQMALQGMVGTFGDYTELEQKREQQRFDADSESRRNALSERHESELAQLREHEQAKTGVVLAESMQRMLAMDEEFQHVLEKEREAFETHMEDVLDNNLTEEEERINKAILEEDWKNEKERLEEEHINKKKAEEAKDKKAKEKADKELAKKEKALLKKQKEEEIALDKELKMKKYEMEKKVFEQQKKQKITEAILSTASGALNAYMSVASLGVPGQIIGAVNAGLATAFGLAQIAIIEAQPPPQKPQLAEGGLISGPGTGTSDSINANVSDGEFVIDASRTRRIQDFLDSNNMGKVVNITIEPGAINIRDDDDEDLDEKIADALARRFERVL